MTRTVILLLFSLGLPLTSWSQQGATDYQAITREPLREASVPGTLLARILVDAASLGGSETRIAELTFPAGYSGPDHQHDAIEIFYVLSGRFGHQVNGQPGVLEPGDIGIVRPGDTIAHSVPGDQPAVVLTIWLPGGAAAPFHVSD